MSKLKLIGLLTAVVISVSLYGCGDTHVVVNNEQPNNQKTNTNIEEFIISDGWHVIDSKTYYYRNNNKLIGWFKDDNGAEHYTDSNGVLVTDTAVDGKHLDKNGFVKKLSSSFNTQSNNDFTYKTYRNKKYGFSIDYPSFYKICTSNDAEDGVMLSSDEGNSTEFTVYGIDNTRFKTVEESYNNSCSWIGSNMQNVYKQLFSDGFVISYDYYDDFTDRKLVYYQCTMFNNGKENIFTIIYPKAEENFYDNIVTHIYHSFNTPGLGVSHP
ncbi:hypothetical protein [Clostridium sp. CMCC3677]|uniref:hypothetical protein n=1 Tax=Clostridium sp. CMCC3677 TaxID=2949963 RepID=UPI0013F0216F|nr:hypothetical protein [Clostridium sp. CMCC3677]NFQ10296.1 hypothetical protein [Clostridium botulinum]